MKKAFANLTGDLAGTYYPLTGMEEKVRQQLVDDHFLFVSGKFREGGDNELKLYLSSKFDKHGQSFVVLKL